MLKIELSGLKFYSYHGLYEEERITGGEYKVDASILFTPRSIPVNYLDETIDYTAIFKLIKQRMEIPTQLLETIATDIAREILTSYSVVEEVIIKVTKINPQLESFEGNVGVEYEWRRFPRKY